MKQTQTYKTYWSRIGFYLLGCLVLALGIIMNTKAGLGVSPIISVPYSISTIWNGNLGNITMVVYVLFILVQMLLHWRLDRRKKAKGEAVVRPLPRVLLTDVLQLLVSVVFTRLLNLFGAFLPDLTKDCAGSFWGTLAGRILFLLIAIVLTGCGAALSLDMRLVPNPADGMVQTLADLFGKSVGLTKNAFDLVNVAFTTTLSLVVTGHLVGIGLGTVLSMIGVGRVIAVFNHFFFHKTARLAGLQLSFGGSAAK